MPEDQAERGERSHWAPALANFRLDQSFLRTRRGILLGLELLLMFLMFICYAASTAAFVTAPLIFIIVNLIFVLVYMTGYHSKLTALSWPCMDFLRAGCSAVIFLILSITSAAKSKEGGSASAAVFGFILTGVLIYDAYELYRTILSEQDPQPEGVGESQSSNLDAE